ncbi:MAG: cytochrome o ubiquinol oxidase subunit III [Alphaproteobacteria bacterium]
MSTVSIPPSGPAAHLQAEQDALEERNFGFWLYLMSDAILFSLLFATYAVMMHNVADGPSGKNVFELSTAFTETMLLLSSTFTFGLASLSVNSRNERGVLLWLSITLLLGVTFLGLEISEFNRLVASGAGPDRSGFLSAFFTLVGTHGLHVAGGSVWIMVMIAQVLTKRLTAPVLSRLFRLGLFWHFLDIVWIGIFSVIYLPGVL